MTEQHTIRVGPRARLSRCAVTTATLVALIATAGCTDSPAPAPLPDDTSAASATPSPSASSSPDGPPTLPPEAKGTSKRAAVAFVRHYVAVLNHAAESLSLDGIRRYSTDDCAACTSIAEAVARVRAGDGRFVGGEWTLVEPKLLPQWRSGVAEVQTVVTYPEQEVYEAAGEAPKRFDAGKTVYTFRLIRTNGGWRVSAIEGLS